MIGTEPFDDLDRLSPTGLAGWADQRSAEVVTVAGAELPFYRDRFRAAGFDPASFQGLGDLGRIPVIREHDIVARQREARGAAAGIERLGTTPGRIVTVSSGTQGTTFLTWPPEWREVQGAFSLRAHWWAGLRADTPSCWWRRAGTSTPPSRATWWNGWACPGWWWPGPTCPASPTGW